MTTEHLIESLDALSIDELDLLINLAQKRKEVKERELRESAKIKFIKAYQDFRKVAPNVTGYICWEYENNCCCELEEQDFDLYEMLDCAIEHGVL